MVARVPVMVERVLVAVQVGTPFTSASMNPLVPIPKKDDVAIAVGAAVAPVPFARTVPAAIEARLNEVPLYDKPVPAVVVAVLYTRPVPSTANSPVVNDGRYRFEVMVCWVEEAFANCEVLDAKTPVR